MNWDCYIGVRIILGLVLLLSNSVASANLSSPSTLPVSIESSRIVLGETEESTVHAVLPQGTIRVFTHAVYGSTQDVSYTKKRELRFTYVPPSQYFPCVDVVVICAQTKTGPVWGIAPIGLVGQGEAKIKTSPRAVTHIVIGKHTFGPVKADRKGHATIAVKVPPGISHGIDAEGESVELHVPKVPRVAFFFQSGNQINRQAATPVPVLVVVLNPDGTEYLGSQMPNVEVDDGTLSPLVKLGAGMYEAEYTPDPLSTKEAFHIRAFLAGDAHPDFVKTIPLVTGDKVRGLGIPVQLMPPVAESPTQPQDIPASSLGFPWLFTSLKGVVSWNFGDMVSGGGLLDFGVRLPSNKHWLGFAVTAGVMYSTTTQQDDIGYQPFKSRTLFIPVLGEFWYRWPITQRLRIVPTVQFGTTYIRNHIVGIGSDNGEQSSTERKFQFTVGVKGGLEYRVWKGAILAEVGFVYVSNDMNTLEGNLSALQGAFGYRLFFY